VDEHFILSGGRDKKISQWEIPENVLAAAHGDYIARELKNNVITMNYPSTLELTRTYYRLSLHWANWRQVFAPHD